jgi:hypothetical protein
VDQENLDTFSELARDFYNTTIPDGYETIDASGEGFGLSVYEDCFALSPLVLKKKWTKLELIRLYNSRKNNADENNYSEKSLSAKRFDKILSDIASLLTTINIDLANLKRLGIRATTVDEKTIVTS